MVALIAEIEGNCFYIIFTIVLVSRRSDLFNVSLQINGYLSLHNQTPLHTTLSKLVFTSYCICFYYIMICSASLACTIGVVSFAWSRCLWTGHYSRYFVYCVVYANQIMIFSTSAAHVSLVSSCLLNPNALEADFEQVIVPVIYFLVICFMPCLLTRHWFVSCQQHTCHQFRLLCIYGVLADFEQVIIRFHCICYCLLTRHWFVQCQQHLCIGVSCSIILVQ